MGRPSHLWITLCRPGASSHLASPQRPLGAAFYPLEGNVCAEPLSGPCRADLGKSPSEKSLVADTRCWHAADREDNYAHITRTQERACLWIV